MATRMASPSARGVTARFAIALLAAACGSVALAQGQQPPPQTQKPPAGQGQPPAQQGQGQPPVFRAEANFVRVDAYPTAGGKPVTDLEQSDFEVSEDGVPQKVQTFEHIVIQAPTVLDRAQAREPNTVSQSREMVAESKARLFVLFLDTYHISRDGAMNIRSALILFLTMALGPEDLIAVMTPEMPVVTVTFARRTASIESLLDRTWDWSRRGTLNQYDPIEEQYMRCYPLGLGEVGRMSGIAREMINRRRERITLEALKGLVVHLGGLREERKAVLAITEGWILYGRETQLTTATSTARVNPFDTEMSRCETDRGILAQETHELDFRSMLNDANKANVSFYPVDPRGLVALDTPFGDEVVDVSTDLNRVRARLDSLRTMAENTDGLAIVDSNDINRGLRRVIDDLTSYYLLGYYSTNTKPDGRFRSIKVKVKRPGVDVRARPGYRAATREEMAAMALAIGTTAPTAPASPVAGAVSSLGKIRADATVQTRAGYVWAAGPDGTIVPMIWLAGEWDPSLASRDEQWKAGVELAITVTAPDKTSLESSKQILTRETRSFVVRVPVPAGQSAGEYSLRLTTKPVGNSLGSTETIRVAVPARPAAGTLAIGQPILFRRGPYTGPAWAVAGDLRFRRQDRMRVEMSVVGPVTSSEARLLDRTGNPLSLPVTTSVRDENGANVVSCELVLAPLGAGDYVVEATVSRGATTQKVLTAFRIVPQ
jgi:VWFA-related protein